MAPEAPAGCPLPQGPEVKGQSPGQLRFTCPVPYTLPLPQPLGVSRSSRLLFPSSLSFTGPFGGDSPFSFVLGRGKLPSSSLLALGTEAQPPSPGSSYSSTNTRLDRLAPSALVRWKLVSYAVPVSSLGAFKSLSIEERSHPSMPLCIFFF